MYYKNIPTLPAWLEDSKDFPIVSTGRTAAIREAWGTPQAQLLASVKVPPTPEFIANLGRVDSAFKIAAPIIRASLKEIDELIALYQLAFLPMSKANILNDLRRAIDNWSHKQPRLPEAMKALKAVVDRDLNLRSPTARYKKAICIALKTGCNYNHAENRVYENSDLNKDYFRWSSNDGVDMQQKCQILWDLIESARAAVARPEMEDDNKTLKIFMAPEFYFRGANGAYSPDIVSEIIPRMRALGTAGPAFQDWLFVFGTAVASIELTEDRCSVCNSSNFIDYKADTINVRSLVAVCTKGARHHVQQHTYAAEVQNVALIQHGANTHMVAKEYSSGIDYIDDKVRLRRNKPWKAKLVPTVSAFGGEQNRRHPAKDMKMESDERLGGCIFTLDGLTIGLEVCLDHKAKNRIRQVGRASKLAHTIQILLIPSYGMTIGDGLFTKPNGILFNVDGRGRGSSEVKLNVAPYVSQNVTLASNFISIYGPFAIPA
jgi:hypothetical protein